MFHIFLDEGIILLLYATILESSTCGVRPVLDCVDNKNKMALFCTIYCDNTVLQNKQMMTTYATLMVTLNCYSPQNHNFD